MTEAPECVYLADLPKLLAGEFLWCPECGGQWSATRGDYFWKPDDDPFVCADCDEPLRLAYSTRSIKVLRGESVPEIKAFIA